MNINYLVSGALQIKSIPSALFSPSCASTMGTKQDKTLEKVVCVKCNSKMFIMHTLPCMKKVCTQNCFIFSDSESLIKLLNLSNEGFHYVDNIQTTETYKQR